MNEIIENCQLEWHKERGVLYVHNKDTGATVLRICGLESQKGTLADGQIDIYYQLVFWSGSIACTSWRIVPTY